MHCIHRHRHTLTHGNALANTANYKTGMTHIDTQRNKCAKTQTHTHIHKHFSDITVGRFNSSKSK